MTSLKSLLTCLVVLTATLASCEELPEFLHVCSKSNPNLNACVYNSVNKLKPKLKAGIPEYDIPSLEPIDIGDLIVAGNVPGQGLAITVKDIKAYGASNWILKKLNVIEYASKYTFQIELPQMYVVGGYVVDGRILFIPVKGAGKFNGNFTGGTGDVRVKGVHKEIDGQTHFLVSKMDIKITVAKGTIDLEGLVGNEKVLGDIINQTINSNFALLSQELIPLIEKSLSRIFKKTANKILERFTLEQLFP